MRPRTGSRSGCPTASCLTTKRGHQDRQRHYKACQVQVRRIGATSVEWVGRPTLLCPSTQRASSSTPPPVRFSGRTSPEGRMGDHQIHSSLHALPGQISARRLGHVREAIDDCRELSQTVPPYLCVGGYSWAPFP